MISENIPRNHCKKTKKKTIANNCQVHNNERSKSIIG